MLMRQKVNFYVSKDSLYTGLYESLIACGSLVTSQQVDPLAHALSLTGSVHVLWYHYLLLFLLLLPLLLQFLLW